MADKARKYNTATKSYIVVDAIDTTSEDVKRNINWKCIEPTCNVNMTLCNAGKPNAYFASHRSEKAYHVGGLCQLSGVSYTPHEYDESTFDDTEFFKRVLSKSKSSSSSKKSASSLTTKHIVVPAKTDIKTIFQLYKAKLHHGSTSSINGIPFNSLIADSDNFSTYKSDINGNKIVRCVAYKSIKSTQHILFTYPKFTPHSKNYYNIAIHISDTKLFNDMCQTLFPKGSSWNTHPHVLLCGCWEIGVVDKNIMPICEFKYKKKQFHTLKFD